MRIVVPETGDIICRKRLRRFDEAWCPRELTFSCYQGFRFLERERVRQWFAEAMATVRAKTPVDVWAYVLMPEHVHLLVAPRELDVEVGRFAGAIKEKVARRGIHWIEQHAPEWLERITVREGTRLRRRFWQPGGGYDRNVRDERALLAMIDYIHANPVRRGLVVRPTDWFWSSARWYAGESDVPIVMDRTLPMFVG